MNTQTKIIVVPQKKLIYAAIFLFILLILLFFILRSGRSSSQNAPEAETEYIAGIYSSAIILNGNPMDIQVTIDSNRIHDISLVNQSQTIATMYPIFDSYFDDICRQILEQNGTADMTYPAQNRYTGIMITNAIKNALDKARPH